jgi:hypothetical protein
MSQKILWLIDCWSIHKSAAFWVGWKTIIHAYVWFLFQQTVPANSNLQTWFYNDHWSMRLQGSLIFGHHLSSKIKFFVGLNLKSTSRCQLWNHTFDHGCIQHGYRLHQEKRWFKRVGASVACWKHLNQSFKSYQWKWMQLHLSSCRILQKLKKLSEEKAKGMMR